MQEDRLFRVIEYQRDSILMKDEIRSSYHSGPMCPEDASLFASALSYLKETYVQVRPTSESGRDTEWWYGGRRLRAWYLPKVVKDSQRTSDPPPEGLKQLPGPLQHPPGISSITSSASRFEKKTNRHAQQNNGNAGL